MTWNHFSSGGVGSNPATVAFIIQWVTQEEYINKINKTKKRKIKKTKGRKGKTKERKGSSKIIAMFISVFPETNHD